MIFLRLITACDILLERYLYGLFKYICIVISKGYDKVAIKELGFCPILFSITVKFLLALHEFVGHPQIGWDMYMYMNVPSITEQSVNIWQCVVCLSLICAFWMECENVLHCICCWRILQINNRCFRFISKCNWSLLCITPRSN